MKKIKILVILTILFILINVFNIKDVYAIDAYEMNLGISIYDIFRKADNFKNAGNNPVISETTAMNEFLPVGQILVMVANATLLIVTAIMAIKWFISAPEGKAKLKGQLIGLVVSIIVIYGAVGIWTIIRSIMAYF